MRHISELIIPGLGRPMQLLRGEVDRFQCLAVYVRDGFSPHESEVMSVDVVKS